jgi:pyrimidine deaminase RibD-like protein
MDEALKQKIDNYADKAYAAAHHTSTQQTALKIAESKARLASRGVILSGATVHEIARHQGEHINTVVQAKAEGLLDAYELYGAEIDDSILATAPVLRAALLDSIGAYPASGLPPGVPAFEHFRPLLETNTGAILNTIACQIEQRKVIPKLRRTDPDRRFEEMAIEEALRSIPEDERPHPSVGAVVVKNGAIVSTAYRGESPKSHAEYIALEEKLPDDLVAGATVYTTLEPCTARKHPKIPCAQRLIERRVGRVFVGMLDPNPEIRGLGIQALNDAGIETQFFPRDLQSQVEELNREFIRVQKERQTRANAPSPKARLEPEVNPKVAEIIKHKGKTVTVFNRQRYGQGYLEGFWPNGAVLLDCTPLWVVLAEPVAKSPQSFSLTNVEVAFDFEKDRLQLTLYR